MWLRMGSFGPVRVATADGTHDRAAAVPRSSTTSTSLLDRPISSSSTCRAAASGASSAPGRAKDFWGVDQDADAFAQFIQRYITNFNRWNSPRFLFGESYGTTRSAVLAKYLQDERHRAQRRRAALVVPQLRHRLQRRRADRRRRLGLRALSADRSRDGVVPSRPAPALRR